MLGGREGSATAQQEQQPKRRQRNTAQKLDSRQSNAAQQPYRKKLRSADKSIRDTWLPVVEVTHCSFPLMGECRKGGAAGGKGTRKRKRGLAEDTLPHDSND